MSFVVVVYDMPLQAQNTVDTLKLGYQRGVSSDDYEVIIVENQSDHLMDEQFIADLPENFSYHLRREDLPTPIFAANFGASEARGENICLMIDGARLLTPGVVGNILLGHRLTTNAIVTVPGYHLGRELQQEAVGNGYSLEAEREMI